MVSKRVIFGAFLFLGKSIFFFLGGGGAFVIKQLFHSHLLDMRLVMAPGYSQLISNARSWNDC